MITQNRTQLSLTFGRKKKGALLVIEAHEAARLKEKGILFTPTIDKPDPDSTRTGPSEFQRRGYQRPPEPLRIRHISRYYLDEDILGFTTPLIVSVRKGLDASVVAALITRAIADDETAIRELDHTLAIIDGQHRGEGAIEATADPDFELDTVLLLLHGLSYEEETELFNVINTTPKRLPKALVEWNRYGITEDTSATFDQEIRSIAVRLATEADSPWYEQVNLTGTGREPGRPVTLEGMRRSLDNMLRAGGLRHLTAEKRYELVKTFWDAVVATFPDPWSDFQPAVQMPDGSIVLGGETWTGNDDEVIRIPRREYRIKELVGVAALAKIGGDILAEALGNTEPSAYVAAEVEKLAEVDWEKREDNRWVRSQAGFAGQRELYDALAFLRAHGVAPWDQGE